MDFSGSERIYWWKVCTVRIIFANFLFCISISTVAELFLYGSIDLKGNNERIGHVTFTLVCIFVTLRACLKRIVWFFTFVFHLVLCERPGEICSSMWIGRATLWWSWFKFGVSTSYCSKGSVYCYSMVYLLLKLFWSHQ